MNIKLLFTGAAALCLAAGAGLAVTSVSVAQNARTLRSVESFDSADAAVAACRRRFKNLPERHFRFLEALVRRHFELGRPSASGPA